MKPELVLINNESKEYSAMYNIITFAVIAIIIFLLFGKTLIKVMLLMAKAVVAIILVFIILKMLNMYDKDLIGSIIETLLRVKSMLFHMI